MTLEQVQEGLQEAPFNLGKDEALLLSRYLTEDNSEEFIRFDKDEK